MQPLTGSLDPILDQRETLFRPTGFNQGGDLRTRPGTPRRPGSSLDLLGYGTIDDSLRHCQCCRQNSFAQVSAEETLDADKFAADFSLDDKAKVSVGEPGHPATAGARPNKKAIVGVGQELRCADHDTGVVAKVVPAVQLRMDLPKNTTDPRTKGKVVVYLRDADSIS